MVTRKTPPQVEIVAPDDPRLRGILILIQDTFAYMEGLIDPPSSIREFDLKAITDHAADGQLVIIGDPPVAAMVMLEKPGTLYLGKLAVSAEGRGQGLARALVGFAVAQARKRGLSTLTLQSRVELADNHAIFRAMGFTETGRTAHAGFDKPTSITFTMPV